MMQREISDRVFLGETLNPYGDTRISTAIDRTTMMPRTTMMLRKKFKKLEISLELVDTMKILPNTYLVCSKKNLKNGSAKNTPAKNIQNKRWTRLS